MRARLGACAAVVSAAALASSATGTGDALSTAGTIAYESQSTVYVADAGGAGTHRPLSSPAYAPSWSPDGPKLAIDSGLGLETIDADGLHRTVLVSGAGLIGPAWSPDGSKIAYANANQGGGVWVVPAVGGAPTRLSSAGVESSPTWSPDGTRIAFLESDISANPPNIWIMNADGSNPHELTTTDLPDPGSFDLRNLAWSPDGTKLLYSTGAEPEVYGAGARPASIAVVDADGSNEHILVTAPQHSTFTDPSWSPDGTSIIFSDTNLSGPVETTQGLDIANTDGSGRRSLLTAPGGYPVATAQWLAGVPGAPAGAWAVAVDSTVAGIGQARVSFTAPATNGGSPVTSYRVAASPGGATAAGSASPITVTGLTVGTTYTFTVTASNAIGAGAASTVSNAVSPASVPDAPTDVSASAGDGQVTVGFGAPGVNGGAAITSYTVTASPGGVTATGPGGPLTVAALANGTTYTFSIVAANRVGAGAAATVSATPVAAGGAGGGGNAGGAPAGGGGGGGAPTPPATPATPVTVTTPVPVATTPPNPLFVSASTVGKTLKGSAKADTLRGTARNDTLVGLGGDDTLVGLGGNDRLHGGVGKDRLYGGSGNDTITGGLGTDAIFGGPGNDTIYAKDGAKDRVDCGNGRDTVYADKTDTVAKDCEAIRRR